MRRIVIFAVILSYCAALSACGSSSSSPSFPKAAAPIANAALAQKSVHWTRTAAVQNGVTYTWAADVSADSGRASMTLPNGAVVQLLLLNDALYVRGDYSGLLSLFSGNATGRPDLTPTQAQRYAGRWISLPKGGDYFRFLADGLTLGSIVHDAIPRRGGLKSFTRNSHGRRLLVLRGRESRSLLRATDLTARASGEPLPIAFSSGGSYSFPYNQSMTYGSSGSSGRFSKWNEPVNVQAPASSTPIAVVRAG